MSGKIITVAQQKGGSGKTTVAVNLAVALMKQKGLSMAMLDLDPQGSLGEWYENRENTFGADETNIEFRTASGWGARREAKSLAQRFDCVVIDTPPHTERDAKRAIEVANLVVVPVQPAPVDIWATESTLDLASSLNIEAVLVMNRVPARARLTEEMEALIEAFGVHVTETRLGNRVAFAEALGKGSAVTETQPRGKSAEEVNRLVEEVFKIVG